MFLFADMLPAPFAAHRGTAVASLALNDKNMEAPSLYLEDIQECDFVIDFEHSKRERLVSHGNISQWETIVNYPFLDASLSPSLYRAFYIPWISKQKNYFGDYKMYRRVSQHNSLDSTVTFPHANWVLYLPNVATLAFGSHTQLNALSKAKDTVSFVISILNFSSTDTVLKLCAKQSRILCIIVRRIAISTHF